MSAMHLGGPGQPVSGWSSPPPPVVSEKQQRADKKAWVIAMVAVGLLALGAV